MKIKILDKFIAWIVALFSLSLAVFFGIRKIKSDRDSLEARARIRKNLESLKTHETKIKNLQKERKNNEDEINKGNSETVIADIINSNNSKLSNKSDSPDSAG